MCTGFKCRSCVLMRGTIEDYESNASKIAPIRFFQWDTDSTQVVTIPGIRILSILL